jgi:hypothetical protein
MTEGKTRLGLYAMVFLTMVTSFTGDDKSKEILNKVNTLEQKVSVLTDVKKQNVLGGKVPEKFYVINGDTAYVEIDGKSTGEYFKMKGDEK